MTLAGMSYFLYIIQLIIYFPCGINCGTSSFLFCSSRVLKQLNGLENLFKHIDIEVFSNKVENVHTNSDLSFGATKSRVILEESAQKLRILDEKYSKSTTGFSWERGQSSPPNECPDLECLKMPDPEKCDLNVEEGKKRYKFACKENNLKRDSGNVLEMCYGYGFEASDKSMKITPNLCLSRIFNILWLLPHHYPGFHSTYLYYGATHTFFPVHVEDALTWSLNYLFLGHPKVWQVLNNF